MALCHFWENIKETSCLSRNSQKIYAKIIDFWVILDRVNIPSGETIDLYHTLFFNS